MAKNSIQSITDSAIFLKDGTRIPLSRADTKLLRFAFPDVCEKCGHDPKDVIE